MPSRLHPRSRFTSSLFATTLFASFFIVALPHILPCPAPKLVAFNDDGTRSTSGRPEKHQEDSKKHTAEKIDQKRLDPEYNKRECPIPRPSGLFGELFGPNSNKSNTSNNNGTKPL